MSFVGTAPTSSFLGAGPPKLNVAVHWTLASTVLAIDVLLVVFTVYQNSQHYVEPPTAGNMDKQALIGWLSVVASIFIFGSYGILIKTPAVQQANTDCMVFQCYYSAAVAATSMAIWAVAGSSEGLAMTGSSFSMGLLFGVIWIISQVLGFNAIVALGMAVAPAIWIGVTIVTSFLWGVAVFDNPIASWPLAILALLLLLVGVVLAAASSQISDRQQETQASGQLGALTGEQRELAWTKNADISKLSGVLCAVLLGVCNGSTMVTLTCFSKGCPAVGVRKYEGDVLPALAFLPSLALGVLVAQPCLFLAYWGRPMCRGQMPEFNFRTVALPGCLTGCFWGMGNFCAMFATTYLGQTIGFPLTQCCLLITGMWGIIYYREITGAKGIITFCVAAGVLLAGATADGMS